MDRRMSVESNSDASFCDLGCSEIDEDDEEQDFSEEPSTQEDSDDGDFEKPVRARVISQSSNKRKSQVLSSSRTASKEKKAPSVVCRVDGKNIEKPSNLDEAHIGSVEETRKPEILIPTGTKADPGSSSTQSKLGGGKDPPKKPKISISNEIKSKMKGTSAKAQVLKALYNRNRPMNATNITDLLGQKVPKGVVQSTLEDLSRSGDASVKEYGKAKVYWFNQAHLPKVSQKDLDDTKKSIEEFMDQCSDLRSRARSLEQEAGSLEASPTDIELEKLLNDEQEKYDILQARSKAIQSAAVDSTPAQIDKKRKLKNKYRGEWVKRRRLCMDIINELADAMEKKPKELQKNMGIETDEGAGVTVPTAEKIMPKPGNFRRSHQR